MTRYRRMTVRRSKTKWKKKNFILYYTWTYVERSTTQRDISMRTIAEQECTPPSDRFRWNGICFFFFMFCFASLCLASNSIRVASNWVFGDGDVRPSCRLRLGVTTAGIDTASQCAQCALINRYDIECCWTVWIEINWLIGHQSAYIALWSARVPIIHKLNRIKIISSNDSLGRMPLAANTYLYFFIQ